MTNIGRVKYDDLVVHFRRGTSDEAVLVEVIEKKCYRRASVGFDVQPGERWLDLGANIGAFAVYAKLKGASSIECYEPEPSCFELLNINAGEFAVCHHGAVTVQRDKTINLWTSSIEGNNYRGTIIRGKGRMNKEPIQVPNIHVSNLGSGFDGIKMDVEGGEFPLLDEDKLPNCDKLCFEYHTSRDSSMSRMKRRINKLKMMFDVVSYTPGLDKMMAMGGSRKPFCDRMIWCMGRKR